MPAERIVVVYRGATPLDVEAPVIRGEITVGVISEVHAQPGAQRVVLALKSAADLRQGDQYLPLKTKRGVGFKVVTGTGAPLRNGDVVEAGLGWRSENPAPLAPAVPAVPERAARDAGRAEAQIGSLPPWQTVSPETDLQAVGIVDKRFARVPMALRRRPEEIVVQARGRRPDEAIPYITRELAAVDEEFAAALREAQARGDREAVPEIRQLQVRTNRLLHRMRAQAAQSR